MLALLEWVLILWNMMGLLLLIPFLVMMFAIMYLWCLITEPKETTTETLNYIKKKIFGNVPTALQEKLSDTNKEEKGGFWEIVIFLIVCLAIYDIANDKDEQKTVSVQKNIDEIQSKGVENAYQTQSFQKSVEATKQLLGKNPSEEELTSHLKRMAEITNKSLPIMVDDETQFFKMVAIHKTIVYNYKVITIPNERNIPNDTVQELKYEMINARGLCKNMGYILSYGVTLSYAYYANNGDYLFSFDVTPNNCGI